MKRALLFPAVAALLAAALATAAHADRVAMPGNPPKAYVQECSACHMAYPPGLLPAAAWKRIMGSLEKHYGTDASLDDKTVAELSGWLQAHAGTYKRATDTADARITSAAWFARKHRDITSETWKRRGVGGAFNCAACHSGAAQGEFSEHQTRIPK